MKNYYTARLILKPTGLGDAEFVFNLLNTPKWKQFIGDRNVNSVAGAEKYIKAKMLPQMNTFGYGNYTVILKESGEKIGSCGLYNRPGLNIPDIGFAFFDEFEGKGYGYEAASRILRAGLEEFDLKKVSAITVKENLASQKLIGKLGLRFQKFVTLPNDATELMYYETP